MQILLEMFPFSKGQKFAKCLGYFCMKICRRYPSKKPILVTACVCHNPCLQSKFDLGKLFGTFFKKCTNPGLFFVYFCLFNQTLQFLQQINVKKCPSSIRHQDSNSQPSDYESPPLPTRPGLPPRY